LDVELETILTPPCRIPNRMLRADREIERQKIKHEKDDTSVREPITSASTVDQQSDAAAAL